MSKRRRCVLVRTGVVVLAALVAGRMSGQTDVLLEVGGRYVQGGLPMEYTEGTSRTVEQVERRGSAGAMVDLAVLIRGRSDRFGVLLGPGVRIGSQRAMVRSVSSTVLPSSMKSTTSTWTGTFKAPALSFAMALQAWWQAAPRIAVTAGPRFGVVHLPSAREEGTVRTVTVRYDPGWDPISTETEETAYAFDVPVRQRTLGTAGVQAGVRFLPLPGLVLGLGGGLEFGMANSYHRGSQAFGAVSFGWMLSAQAAPRPVEN